MDADIQVAVESAQRGNREAFGVVYEQLAPKVYSYLYHRTNGRAHLAEDLTEEVFVKVLERLCRYQNLGLPFASWVYRIAHNHLVDYLRSQPKQGTVPIDDCYDLVGGQAENLLNKTLTASALTMALPRLTEDQRRVLVLRFVQGMNMLETARTIGKTDDAVKKLQARGLLSLRRILGKAALADLRA